MTAAIDIPAQGLHLHLAGGMIHNPGDRAMPIYRGALDTSSGAISMEIRVDTSGTCEPRQTVSIDGMAFHGHGQRHGEFDEPDIREMDVEPKEILVDVPEQRIDLVPLSDEDAAQYGIEALCGTVTTSIGSWAVTHVEGDTYMTIGRGFTHKQGQS